MLDEATVRLLVGGGCTHRKISDYYQTLYPTLVDIAKEVFEDSAGPKI